MPQEVLSARSAAHSAANWSRTLTAIASGERTNQFVLVAVHGRSRVGLIVALMSAAARRLIEMGAGSMIVRVLDANRSARGFYERLGGQLMTETRGVEESGMWFPERAYRWPDLSAVPPASRAGRWLPGNASLPGARRCQQMSPQTLARRRSGADLKESQAMRRLGLTLGAAALSGLLSGCAYYGCGPYGDQPCYYGYGSYYGYGPYYGYGRYYGAGPYSGYGPYYGHGPYYGPGPYGPGAYHGPGPYHPGASLNAYYDGFYGPYFDGYWGPGGVFYYRSTAGGAYHRDAGAHFRHETASGFHAVQAGEHHSSAPGPAVGAPASH